jgi:flagellar biosynthesis anti-sigma factor FlgM
VSKIHANLCAAVQPFANAPERGGTNVADAVTSGVEVSVAQSLLLASSALSTRAPASTEAPVDVAKIEQLRAAVLDGSYKIDAHAIADRIVDLEKVLP